MSAQTRVRVAETGDGPFTQEVTAGPHVLAPAAPYEFLLAALGACTAMTLRMYAARKGWPLEKTAVDLAHGKEDGRDRITRVLTLSGPLDAVQRARLLEIANKCPVHRTLEPGADIATELNP